MQKKLTRYLQYLSSCKGDRTANKTIGLEDQKECIKYSDGVEKAEHVNCECSALGRQRLYILSAEKLQDFQLTNKLRTKTAVLGCM